MAARLAVLLFLARTPSPEGARDEDATQPTLQAGERGDGPCDSKQCLEHAAYLKSFLDTSVDPCVDFAAYTCSPKKKVEFSVGAPSIMKRMQVETFFTVDEFMRKGLGDETPAGDFLGSGLAPLVSGIRTAHSVCKQEQTSDVPPDRASHHRASQAARLAGRTFREEDNFEKVVADAGIFTEPSRNSPVSVLGVHAHVITPLFALLILTPAHTPSENVKLFLVPRFCWAPSGSDDVVNASSEIERELGQRLFTVDAATAAEYDNELLVPHREDCTGALMPKSAKDTMEDISAQPFYLHGLQEKLDDLAKEVADGDEFGFDLRAALMAAGVPEGARVHVVDFKEGSLKRWVDKMVPLVRADVKPRTRAAVQFAFAVRLADQHLTMSRSGCREIMQYNFPWLWIRKYATDTLTDADTDEATELAWELVGAFADGLDGLPWISKATLRKAKHKLRNVRVKVGYPSWIMRDALLSRHYAVALDFRPGTAFLEMYHRMQAAHVQRMLSAVDVPRDWESFWMVPFFGVVNAAYNSLANDMIIPATFLQKPMFDAGAPMAFNFGSVGAIVGHELTHGFDTTGATRDSFGNRRDWWSEESRRHFQEMEACFVHQYGSYPLHGDLPSGERGANTTYDNGTHCVNENIADSGGLGLAVLAYRRWRSRHGEEPRLAGGLEGFTPEQLLFLRFGATWCDYLPEEQLLKEAASKVDVHSFDRLRAVGAVQNSRTFQEAFGCPAGAPMSPVSRCELWAIDGSAGGAESGGEHKSGGEDKSGAADRLLAAGLALLVGGGLLVA